MQLYLFLCLLLYRCSSPKSKSIFALASASGLRPVTQRSSRPRVNFEPLVLWVSGSEVSRQDCRVESQAIRRKDFRDYHHDIS
ncbi:hypothetical protein BJ138DRAFT_1157565 [Hygrophoropsis aurantiaca]|uniref:Uncharacterized protein n=1 Tax=Hygrophoropsis aurantiaca TaxID=72124 RepID=A0ACB8A5X1_9AGAM|nr:hypothetical protein BJ138DRAFT_1157565 [Hygrophoropsis aurantiaca]